MMVRTGVVVGVMVVIAGGLLSRSVVALAADASAVEGGGPQPSNEREVRDIKDGLRALEHRVDELENENTDLRKSNAELREQAQKQQTATTAQIQTIQSQVAAEPSPTSFTMRLIAISAATASP